MFVFFSEMCTYYICIYIYKYAYICAYIYIYIVLFGWLNTTHSCADGIPWPPVSKRDADILAFRHHSSSTLGVLMIFFTAAIQIKEYIKTYVILIYIYIYLYPMVPQKSLPCQGMLCSIKQFPFSSPQAKARQCLRDHRGLLFVTRTDGAYPVYCCGYPLVN